MSSYFEFMDVNSQSDLHIMITKPLVRPTWTEEIEYISIPQKAEKQQSRSGVYENKEVTVEGVVDSQYKSEIYGELHGTGALVFSSAENERMHAEVTEIRFEPVTNDLYEVSITFSVLPFVQKHIEEFQSVSKNYTMFENTGSFDSEPIFRIRMNQDSAPILKGDVNFDGVIDAVDASLVLAEYAHTQAGGEPTFTPEQFEAADMDDDGHITPSDASEILRIYTDQQTGGQPASIPSKNVILVVNGEDFIIGVPDAAIINQYLIYVDCEEKLLYYYNDYGDKINILQYSQGNFPRLAVGENYIKYQGDCEFVDIKLNERWR